MVHKKTSFAASVLLFTCSLIIFLNPKLIHAQNTPENKNIRTQINELKKQIAKEKTQIRSLKEKQRYFIKKKKILQKIAEKIKKKNLLKKTGIIRTQKEKEIRLTREKEKYLAEEKLKHTRKGLIRRQKEEETMQKLAEKPLATLPLKEQIRKEKKINLKLRENEKEKLKLSKEFAKQITHEKSLTREQSPVLQRPGLHLPKL